MDLPQSWAKMTGAQSFNHSGGELKLRTILPPSSWCLNSHVSLGKTPRRVISDHCLSQSMLRTGSSRHRHAQARFTALLRLSMRTSWLAMCLVNSLILRTRWGVLSWVMVTCMETSADEVARAASALYTPPWQNAILYNWDWQSSCGRVFGQERYLFMSALYVLYDKRDSGVRLDEAEDPGGRIQEC